jgi:hypothetical protein
MAPGKFTALKIALGRDPNANDLEPGWIAF